MQFGIGVALIAAGGQRHGIGHRLGLPLKHLPHGALGNRNHRHSSGFGALCCGADVECRRSGVTDMGELTQQPGESLTDVGRRQVRQRLADHLDQHHQRIVDQV